MKKTENAERPISAMTVFAVAAWPFALVREAGTNTFQLGDQGLQDRHGAIESMTVPRR
jgi:hypothetical protein